MNRLKTIEIRLLAHEHSPCLSFLTQLLTTTPKTVLSTNPSDERQTSEPNLSLLSPSLKGAVSGAENSTLKADG